MRTGRLLRAAGGILAKNPRGLVASAGLGAVGAGVGAMYGDNELTTSMGYGAAIGLAGGAFGSVRALRGRRTALAGAASNMRSTKRASAGATGFLGKKLARRKYSNAVDDFWHARSGIRSGSPGLAAYGGIALGTGAMGYAVMPSNLSMNTRTASFRERLDFEKEKAKIHLAVAQAKAAVWR